MTTRNGLVDDMQGVETILCALDGIGKEIPDKVVIRAICRALWHILEYMIGGIKHDGLHGTGQGGAVL